jgi:murein tripeptide amidase MpaA
MEKLQEFDVWKTSVQSVQVLATTRSEEQTLISSLLNCIVLIDDINLEAKKWQLQDYRFETNLLQADTFFTQFQTYDAISNKIDEWVQLYPKYVTKIAIGNTVQGRDIICLKVSNSFSNQTKKSVIWSGGIHAREWAGPATVMYIADKLLKGKTNWLEHFDFHICPSQNPDGYQYTRKKRLWRKNMARNYDGSMGVDLNRNFDVKWGKVRHFT